MSELLIIGQTTSDSLGNQMSEFPALENTTDETQPTSETIRTDVLLKVQRKIQQMRHNQHLKQ